MDISHIIAAADDACCSDGDITCPDCPRVIASALQHAANALSKPTPDSRLMALDAIDNINISCAILMAAKQLPREGYENDCPA